MSKVVALALLFVAAFAINSSYSFNSLMVDEQTKEYATNARLTTSGKNIFYQARPEFEAKSDVVRVCGGNDDNTILLGCYIPKQNKIYILNNHDDVFQAVSTVTLAHEMLHKAYDSLPFWQKNTIRNNLLYEYENNKELKAMLIPYENQSLDVLLDEAHSFLGTQVQNLNPEMEKYYSKYFMDRQHIVSKYRSVIALVEISKEKIDAVTLRLDNLKDRMDKIQNEYEACKTSSNYYCINSTAREYNKSVPEYNALVEDFNSVSVEYKSLIERYSGDAYGNYGTVIILNQ